MHWLGGASLGGGSLFIGLSVTKKHRIAIVFGSLEAGSFNIPLPQPDFDLVVLVCDTCIVSMTLL